MKVTSARRVLYPTANRYPLELYWSGDDGQRPVPSRAIRKLRSHPTPAFLPPVWLPAFRHLPAHRDQGLFNFSLHMHRLCADIASRSDDLRHLDVDRILMSVTQARTRRTHGLQAKVTPLRCHGGELFRRRRGRTYQVQRYWVDGVEVLYLLTFCLPRFLDQSFEEKFVTIFHELYHIAPTFDGDLRRHDGRYALHTRSRKGYDRRMFALAREYLTGGADPSLHAFLRLSFDELHARHGGVAGHVVPVPKLIPIG